MRNISCALTIKPMQDGSKSVTRRMGWLRLNPGDMLQPVEKGMGLKPGEKIVRICEPIRVLGVRREPLRAMIDDVMWGIEECKREGFTDMVPSEFVRMFCATHKGCTPDSVVTRIEFEHTGRAHG